MISVTNGFNKNDRLFVVQWVHKTLVSEADIRDIRVELNENNNAGLWA